MTELLIKLLQHILKGRQFHEALWDIYPNKEEHSHLKELFRDSIEEMVFSYMSCDRTEILIYYWVFLNDDVTDIYDIIADHKNHSDAKALMSVLHHVVKLYDDDEHKVYGYGSRFDFYEEIVDIDEGYSRIIWRHELELNKTTGLLTRLMKKPHINHRKIREAIGYAGPYGSCSSTPEHLYKHLLPKD